MRGEAGLREHDPGGLEPLEMTLDDFRDALTRERHTLKRTLTDPHLFSGIGNAYSDEILHAARLSPVTLTAKLSEPDVARLFAATTSTPSCAARSRATPPRARRSLSRCRRPGAPAG